MDVEVAHSVEKTGRLQKWLAALLGISAVVAASLATLDLLAERQNRMLDQATRYGNRSSRAVFALSLVALSTVLLGLAAVMKARSGAAPLVGGAGVLLLVAVGWGATAFLE